MTQSNSTSNSTRRLVSTALATFVAVLSSRCPGVGIYQVQKVESHIIRGEILADPKSPAFKGATVNVSLEMVTELDAEAQVVALLTMNKVSGGGLKGRPIRFVFGEFEPAPDT